MSESAPSELYDRWQRRITRLRLGVSNKCDLHCVYCRPTAADGHNIRPEIEADEIVTIVDAAVACGIQAVRLTGGEPLLREDLAAIVSRISMLHPNLDLSLTTNGRLLADKALELAEAGLKRVNVSLDSLRPECYRTLTGGEDHRKVLAGIEAAARAGLSPIKINAVIIRDINDDEIADMVAFAGPRGYHMRFIEFMPMDGSGRWTAAQVVTIAEMRRLIETHFELTPMLAGESPGEEYLLTEFGSRLSLIGAVSQPFCHRCNRLRVTADGFLRGCLFSKEEYDLRPALDSVNPKQALIELLITAASGKPHSHCIGREGFERPTRSMFSTGG